jgi:hypothetical protein
VTAAARQRGSSSSRSRNRRRAQHVHLQQVCSHTLRLFCLPQSISTHLVAWCALLLHGAAGAGHPGTGGGVELQHGGSSGAGQQPDGWPRCLQTDSVDCFGSLHLCQHVAAASSLLVPTPMLVCCCT